MSQYDEDLGSAWSFGANTQAERERSAEGAGYARSEILKKLTEFYTATALPVEPMDFIHELIIEIRKQLVP